MPAYLPRWLRAIVHRRCAFKDHRPVRGPFIVRYLQKRGTRELDLVLVEEMRCRCGKVSQSRELERTPQDRVALTGEKWNELDRMGKLRL